MRRLSVLALVLLFLGSIGLAALNPALVLFIAGGIFVGMLARAAFLAVTSAPPEGQPAARRRGLPLSIELFAILAVIALAVLTAPFLLILPPVETIVRAAYLPELEYDSAKTSWSVTDRYRLGEASVKEALRLLSASGVAVPESPTPEEVGTILTTAAGDNWNYALETGQPELVRARVVQAPPGGRWSYESSVALGRPPFEAFDLLPGEGSAATVRAPRYFVLQAEPTIAVREGLESDPDETIRIPIADDTEELRLRLAPGWARTPVLAPAMGFSLASFTGWLVGGIAGALSSVVSGAVVGWTVRWLRKALGLQEPPARPAA